MTSTSLKFGTKAETLSNLKNVIKSASILPLEFIAAKEWREEKELCLMCFFQNFMCKKRKRI